MTAPSNTADALLKNAIARLKDAGIDDPRFEARLMLGHILDVQPSWFLSHGDDLIDKDQAARFQDFLAQRLTGKPVSRITGSRGFWTLDLGLNDATLDPRPDSECLIEACIKHFPDQNAELRLLDLGTGTGCLLLAALSEFRNAWGLGVDLSPDAAIMAKNNAVRNALSDRSAFIAGDWASAVKARFDLILCNPPYIGRGETGFMNREALDHDPDLALFADDNGFAAWTHLMPRFATLLTPQGKVVLECGFRQTVALADLATRNDLQVLEELIDLGNNPRGLVLAAK